jgi:hypothetical protein
MKTRLRLAPLRGQTQVVRSPLRAAYPGLKAWATDACTATQTCRGGSPFKSHRSGSPALHGWVGGTAEAVPHRKSAALVSKM